MQYGELIVTKMSMHCLTNDDKLLDRIWCIHITWSMAPAHAEATAESKGSQLFV